jgi:hypothetical protein
MIGAILFPAGVAVVLLNEDSFVAARDGLGGKAAASASPCHFLSSSMA